MTYTAADIARRVSLGVDHLVNAEIDWTDRPDGDEILALANGWHLAIGDDGEGISWALHNPAGEDVTSGGWGDESTVGADIASLSEMLALKVNA